MLVVCADIHLQEDTPEDLHYGQQLLKDGAMLCRRHSVKHLVVAGDFFHYKLKISPRLLYTTLQTLKEMRKSGVDVVVIPGNHDRPDSNDVGWTPLSLFSDDCTLINETRVVESKDAIIAFVPWYPPGQYRKEINRAAQAVMGSRLPRILISHVSIQVGKVSPSNMRLTVPIRYADLMPGVWTGGIYLGDYHAHQLLPGGNGMYCGAPRHQTFGDFDCLGMWLVGARFADRKLLHLPTRYPQFNTWRVDGPDDLPLQGYDSRDKNRIMVSDEMIQHVAYHYPGARLIRADRESLEVVAPRILGGMEPVAVMLRWREEKGFPAEPYTQEIEALF